MKIKFSKKLLALVLAGSFVICGTKAGEVRNEKEVVEDINYDDYELIDSKKVSNKEIGTEEIEKTKEDLTMKFQKYVIANNTVNIRTAPSGDSEKVGSLSNGESLVMLENAVDGWYKVKYNDTDCYVSSSYVEEESKTEVASDVIKSVYFDNDSYIYDDKDLNDSIASVKKLQTANVYFENDDNYVASVDGNVGYINKKDVKVLDGVYVVVDLSDQELTLYQDNDVILTTPVVTGKPSTPTNAGDFEVYDKTRNRYLLNDDGTPNVYVDVMMKFDGNRGIHDANWRSVFGGNIYLTNGSHGCVNTPHDNAIKVAEYVDVGTKVLVKE